MPIEATKACPAGCRTSRPPGLQPISSSARRRLLLEPDDLPVAVESQHAHRRASSGDRQGGEGDVGAPVDVRLDDLG